MKASKASEVGRYDTPQDAVGWPRNETTVQIIDEASEINSFYCANKMAAAIKQVIPGVKVSACGDGIWELALRNHSVLVRSIEQFHNSYDALIAFV